VIAEPAVTLSDWAIALECGVLAWLTGRAGDVRAGAARGWLVAFFAFTAVAALAGGAVHGLFPDPKSQGQRWLWPFTLFAVGATAWSAWAAGGYLVFGRRAARAIATLAGAGFALYALIAWRAGFAYAVAIAGYLPAACFLLVVFAWLRWRVADGRLGQGVAGLVLTFVAAAVQRDVVWLGHNTAYHVIQAVALFLIYRGGVGAMDAAARRQPA
jgi:hypothetical protein